MSYRMMGAALLVSLGFITYSVASPANEPSPETEIKVSEIAESGNQFAIDLYQQLRSQDGNLFFSPSSISTALAMTYGGAAGETEAEMAKTLHFELPQAELHNAMSSLQSLWITSNQNKDVRLNLANRLWGHQGYEFLPAFLKLTREKYSAQLARLNFAKPEDAKRTINDWVQDRTEGKIQNLIPSGVLTPDTRLVLTNAVYFYGNWSTPFMKQLTRDQDFHLSAINTIKVPTMYQQGKLRYGEVDDLQILELPYGDGDLSMVILLPKEIDGLAGLESKLSLENLKSWLGSVKIEDAVQVTLPKFKTTSQFELADALQAMGMRQAFNARTADFSGMTGDRDLFISAVVHKAFVDVNEAGTEAAAATGVVISRTSVPIKAPPFFRADHPFVFLIRDNRHGGILFLGRMTDPSN